MQLDTSRLFHEVADSALLLPVILHFDCHFLCTCTAKNSALYIAVYSADCSTTDNDNRLSPPHLRIVFPLARLVRTTFAVRMREQVQYRLPQPRRKTGCPGLNRASCFVGRTDLSAYSVSREPGAQRSKSDWLYYSAAVALVCRVSHSWPSTINKAYEADWIYFYNHQPR